MDGSDLFRVRTEASTRVLTEMLEICLHNKKIDGYAYSHENILLTHIERVLERQLYEDSSNRMKRLSSNVNNALNKYKSTIHIKNRDVLAASRVAAERASTDNSTVDPEITNNSDAQDKADWQNAFRLASIGVKEGITEGITKIVGRDITNPILRTTDNRDFKSVGQYQIHQLLAAIA